jgi:hypothetical protein
MSETYEMCVTCVMWVVIAGAETIEAAHSVDLLLRRDGPRHHADSHRDGMNEIDRDLREEVLTQG